MLPAAAGGIRCQLSTVTHEQFRTTSTADPERLWLLLLEGVDDARNLGFTLRTADALGLSYESLWEALVASVNAKTSETLPQHGSPIIVRISADVNATMVQSLGKSGDSESLGNAPREKAGDIDPQSSPPRTAEQQRLIKEERMQQKAMPTSKLSSKADDDEIPF